MKVLVVQQPWAWLIVNGYKDIENRTWSTRYRGPLLIQASAALPSKRELDALRCWVRKRDVELPETFEAGGIVGMAHGDDCVTKSRSKWFQGPIGWQLSKAKKLPFMPIMKRQLGLFGPPTRILRRLRSLSK